MLRSMSATIVRLDAAQPRPRRVAVGKFDGLHLGHRAVISGCDAVCTFDPHPSVVLASGPPPPLLTSLRRRAELLGEMGVHELIVLPFDEAMRARSPATFVEEVLLDALDTTHVRVGADFRFGHRAAGRPADLEADERLRCRVIEPVVANGATVSSTRIRALVAAGAVDEAAELLGAPHALWCRGAVEHAGALELDVPRGLALPPPGTYVVRLLAVGGERATTGRCRVVERRGPRIVLDGPPAATVGEELRVEFVERIAPRAARPSRRAAQHVA